MLQLSPALLTRRSHFVFLFVLLCLAGSAATPFGRRVLAGYWPAVKRVLPLTTPSAPPPLFVPQTFTVANTADSGLGSLRQAILDANANPGPDVIDATGVTGTITINPANYFLVITDDVTINGPGQANLTISGGNASRIFWIQNGTITIQDLTLANGLAKGGNGGGGGMGAGGAIFMHEGKQGTNHRDVASGNINLTLVNVLLKDNAANGGNGGFGNSGGGGMGGNGGSMGSGLGGGGVLGNGVEAGGSVTNAGVGSNAPGDNGGIPIFGKGGTESGLTRNYGGFGGGGYDEDGGFAGGGAGSVHGGGSFGRGGFGGGGGGAGTDNNFLNNGGARGGFGGGGGGLGNPGNGSAGNAASDNGQPGFGGGQGTTSGGGGLGAGGAIFVASGTLTMQNVRFQNNTATGGTGGNNGQGLGGAVFIFNKTDNGGAAAPGTTNDPQVKGCKVIYTGNTASTSDNNVFGSVGVVSGCDTSSIQLALDPVASPTGAAEELIGAITIANQDPAPTTIKLLCGTYRYSTTNNWEFGPNALPIIQSNITIEGNGAVLDSTAITRLRFFYVAGQNVGNLTSGTLTLQDLTLQNGKQKGGDSRGNGGGSGMGGAIFNHGAVTLDRVTLQGNTATGGSSINGAVNFQDQGGGGIGEDGQPTQNQGGGFGGTPIGTGGTGGTSASVSYGGGGGGFRPGDNGGNATFSAPGAGGGGGLLGGEGGGFGSGAGFERGAPGDGGGGGGRDASLPGSVGPGGAYGFGGIGGSVAGGGGGGVGGGGGGGIGGGGGFGGGGVGTSGTARGGGGGFGGGGGRGAGPGGFAGGNGGGCCNTFGGGGGGGLGGAIFNHLGTLTLINTTLTGNTAQGGNGSSSTQAGNGGGGNGGSGFGGAIFNLNGTVTVTSSTLAGNTVMAGAAGTGTPNGSPGGADGGAIYNLAYGNTFTGGMTTATVTISNSILATSVGGTNDLVNDKRDGSQPNAATVTFTNGNLVMARTTLNSATTNGTPTLTSNPNLAANLQVLSNCVAGMCKPAVLALPTNSPAIGAALGSWPATDQTGTARPLSTAAALGAYEPCGVTPNLSAALTDPIVCNGVGGIVIVTAQLTNLNNFQAGANFIANLPAELSAITGSCTATTGTCNIVNAGQVNWNGNLNANQTVTIQYQALVANGTPANQQLCVNSTGTVAGLMRSVQACGTANCPPNNLNNPPTNIGVSSQKAGSLLVYPYYTAKSATKSDTRLTISNIGTTDTIAHLFFIDGTSCQQADFFVCLTANASFSFKASEYDPETTGWVLAVAVNKQGQPVQNNSLIGNAFVTDGNYVDNYGAESFFARSNDVAVLQNNTARLLFNDVGYEAVPDQFAVELQSSIDAPGQRLVTVGLLGDLTTGQLSGAAQVGVGLITNGNEKPSGSFSALLQGNCQALATISLSQPRVPGGMATMILSSQVGTMRFNVGASVGLLLTPRSVANRWHGIRALHKTHTTFSTLTIPLVVPVC